jgi:phage regulator Rha-like protein
MEELVKSRSSEELISSRQIAEVTDKRHADVIRDIRVLVDKKAIDLIVNLNANLRSIQDEPICCENQYIAQNGKTNPEYLLNEFAANVLAASYDPVIARKLLKLVKELKKAIDTPETFMARALLMAKDTMDKQKKQLELKEKQLQNQAPVVEYANKVLKSTSGHTPSVIASELNMSAVTLNKMLVRARFLRKTGKRGEYSLYANYQGQGYVIEHTHDYERPDGSIGTKISLEYTEKGRRKIHEITSRAIVSGVLSKRNGRYFINYNWEPVKQNA